jgi:hypothetical protein
MGRAATRERFVDEADVCFTLYRQWIGDLNGYLRDKGVAADVISPQRSGGRRCDTPQARRGTHAGTGTASCRSPGFTAATYREQKGNPGAAGLMKGRGANATIATSIHTP